MYIIRKLNLLIANGIYSCRRTLEFGGPSKYVCPVKIYHNCLFHCSYISLFDLELVYPYYTILY